VREDFALDGIIVGVGPAGYDVGPNTENCCGGDVTCEWIPSDRGIGV
jgi:hypothetical protein